MKEKAKLFGSSGVRGLANVDLTPALASNRNSRESGQQLDGLVCVGGKIGLGG